MCDLRSLKHAWKSWEQINSTLGARRLVFFGRGYWLEKTVAYLTREASYIVDNNKYEQGQEEAGIRIFAPDVLAREERGDIYVLITTSAFMEVGEQLFSMGMMPGEDFSISPALANFEVITRMTQNDRELYFTCSDQHREERDDCGGGLYRLCTGTGRAEKVTSGLCHGAQIVGNRMYIVDDTKGLLVLDEKRSVLRCQELPKKSRPHGIAYDAKRQKLLVSYSGRDSVATLDARTLESESELFISHKWKRTGLPHHHVNDLCVKGDSLYVSMFSRTGNWKSGIYDGAIIEYDLVTGERLGSVATNLWMPHNPMFIGDTLHYCDSMRGVVKRTSYENLSEFNGFVRGLAYDGQFYYVAQSRHRYVDRRKGTSNNISLDAGVFVLDPDTKVTKFFPLENITNIHSLFTA